MAKPFFLLSTVLCFNLDKLQEVMPLGFVVFTISSHTRVSGHPVYN